MAVLLNGLIALKAIAQRLPEQVFSKCHEEASHVKREADGCFAFKQLIQSNQSALLNQKCTLQLDPDPTGQPMETETQQNKAKESKCFRRADHQATTVGSNSERSTTEDCHLEEGHLGKRFPQQLCSQTFKNPRKFSLDTANIEPSSLERPKFFDDNLVNSDGTPGRKLRKSSASDGMLVEESAQTSAGRLTQLSFDQRETYQNNQNRYDLSSMLGQPHCGFEHEEEGQLREDIPLSRTSSGISSCTLNLNEIIDSNQPQSERTQPRWQLSAPQPSHQSSTTAPPKPPSLFADHCQASHGDQAADASGRQSASGSVSDRNLALDSLLASLERADAGELRSCPKADDLLLFLKHSTDPTYLKSLEDAASRYAETFAGKYVPVKVRHMNTFTFKCCLGHKFDLVSSQITENAWCEKCAELWESLQKLAKKKDSTILDQSISGQVNVRCMRSHLFTVKPSEYAFLTREKTEQVVPRVYRVEKEAERNNS
jgi:hypothetical protein